MNLFSAELCKQKHSISSSEFRKYATKQLFLSFLLISKNFKFQHKED